MRYCIFIAAGDISEKYFDELMKLQPAPYLTAVDAGYAFLRKKQINPDIALGDFDSLKYVPSGETKIFPARKDKTDMMLAIEHAREAGFETVFVLGGFGGKRLDHTIANIQQMLGAHPHPRLIFLDDENVCFCLKDETAEIRENSLIIRKNDASGPAFEMPAALAELAEPKKRYLSLFTQTGAKVTLSGTAYDGEDIELTGSFPLGVSNEITGEKARIRVSGKVFVMLSGTLER